MLSMYKWFLILDSNKISCSWLKRSEDLSDTHISVLMTCKDKLKEASMFYLSSSNGPACLPLQVMSWPKGGWKSVGMLEWRMRVLQPWKGRTESSFELVGIHNSVIGWHCNLTSPLTLLDPQDLRKDKARWGNIPAPFGRGMPSVTFSKTLGLLWYLPAHFSNLPPPSLSLTHHSMFLPKFSHSLLVSIFFYSSTGSLLFISSTSCVSCFLPTHFSILSPTFTPSISLPQLLNLTILLRFFSLSFSCTSPLCTSLLPFKLNLSFSSSTHISLAFLPSLSTMAGEVETGWEKGDMWGKRELGTSMLGWWW